MVLYRVSVSLNKRTRFSYENFSTDEEAYESWYASRTKEESGGSIIFEKVDPNNYKILTGDDEITLK